MDVIKATNLKESNLIRMFGFLKRQVRAFCGTGGDTMKNFCAAAGAP